MKKGKRKRKKRLKKKGRTTKEKGEGLLDQIIEPMP